MDWSSENLPQTEAEWLQTGMFNVEKVFVNNVPIQCASVRGASNKMLIAMSGGIPREAERQQNLPLINKLYGLLAVQAQQHGISSVLYNQPATGKSGGEWGQETLRTRTNALRGVVSYFQNQFSAQACAIVGSSAGAYMAVRATRDMHASGMNVSKLILLSPAAYPEKLEGISYGTDFTKVLKEPWDVATSPVFVDLEHYLERGGKALVCFFEADDPPIPLYIQEHYITLMRHSSHNDNGESVLTIPNVAHNFRKLNRKRRENVTDDESIKATSKKFLEFLIL